MKYHYFILPLLVLFVNSALAQVTTNSYAEPHQNLPDGIRMECFVDLNNNGIMDGFEHVSPFSELGTFHYEVDGEGVSHAINASSMGYTLYNPVPDTNYRLSMSILPDVPYTVNNEYNIIYTDGSGMTTCRFAVQQVPFTDLDVRIKGGDIRPGIGNTQQITFTNRGNQPILSGTLTYVKDTHMTITNVSVAVTNTPAGFTLNFTNLPPGATRSFDVTLQSPNVPVVNIGENLVSSLFGSTSPGDSYLYNNQSILSQTVNTTYLPNDITECHGPEILFSSFTADDYLTYTIRFENTDNIHAANLKVIDLLDQKLDESTIKMVDASHDYVLDRVDNSLTWLFNNINLEPSVQNTNIGKGYIVFDVKPKPGYSIGDIIPNYAEVYFDLNPAIITNTYESEFVATLGTRQFAASDVRIYPNPTQNIINIALKDQNIDSVRVFDLPGKNVFSQEVGSSQAQIDLSGFSRGMYLVEINASGAKKTFKIVRE